jgi:hypothetical protein
MLMFGFAAHYHILSYNAPKIEKLILAHLKCCRLRATTGVKTTSTAGVKRCIDSFEPI